MPLLQIMLKLCWVSIVHSSTSGTVGNNADNMSRTEVERGENKSGRGETRERSESKNKNCLSNKVVVVVILRVPKTLERRSIFGMPFSSIVVFLFSHV